MQFVDKCLSDSAVYTIENMVTNHISGNYQDVRNIILGYNSKNNIWESKYGEYIAKRYILDMKPFTTLPVYILRSKQKIKDEKKAKDESSKDKKIENFSKNDGMIFYDDEVYDNIRIYMDDSIIRVLEVLFTLSKSVIEYRDIVDIIITEWNTNNVTDVLSLNGSYTNPGICGSLHYYQLEVRKNPWEDLKKITRHKGLTIRDAFKDAVIAFLENRSEMIKGNTIERV
jgi:hypothetical protein